MLSLPLVLASLTAAASVFGNTETGDRALSQVESRLGLSAIKINQQEQRKESNREQAAALLAA